MLAVLAVLARGTRLTGTGGGAIDPAVEAIEALGPAALERPDAPMASLRTGPVVGAMDARGATDMRGLATVTVGGLPPMIDGRGRRLAGTTPPTPVAEPGRGLLGLAVGVTRLEGELPLMVIPDRLLPAEETLVMDVVRTCTVGLRVLFTLYWWSLPGLRGGEGPSVGNCKFAIENRLVCENTLEAFIVASSL